MMDGGMYHSSMATVRCAPYPAPVPGQWPQQYDQYHRHVYSATTSNGSTSPMMYQADDKKKRGKKQDAKSPPRAARSLTKMVNGPLPQRVRDHVSAVTPFLGSLAEAWIKLGGAKLNTVFTPLLLQLMYDKAYEATTPEAEGKEELEKLSHSELVSLVKRNQRSPEWNACWRQYCSIHAPSRRRDPALHNQAFLLGAVLYCTQETELQKAQTQEEEKGLNYLLGAIEDMSGYRGLLLLQDVFDELHGEDEKSVATVEHIPASKSLSGTLPLRQTAPTLFSTPVESFIETANTPPAPGSAHHSRTTSLTDVDFAATFPVGIQGRHARTISAESMPQLLSGSPLPRTSHSRTGSVDMPNGFPPSSMLPPPPPPQQTNHSPRSTFGPIPRRALHCRTVSGDSGAGVHTRTTSFEVPPSLVSDMSAGTPSPCPPSPFAPEAHSAFGNLQSPLHPMDHVMYPETPLSPHSGPPIQGHARHPSQSTGQGGHMSWSAPTHHDWSSHWTPGVPYRVAGDCEMWEVVMSAPAHHPGALDLKADPSLIDEMYEGVMTRVGDDGDMTVITLNSSNCQTIWAATVFIQQTYLPDVDTAGSSWQSGCMPMSTTPSEEAWSHTAPARIDDLPPQQAIRSPLDGAVRVGEELYISPDVAQVKALVDATEGVGWLNEQAVYCGKMATVVRYDDDDRRLSKVRLRNKDGSEYTWALAACSYPPESYYHRMNYQHMPAYPPPSQHFHHPAPPYPHPPHHHSHLPLTQQQHTHHAHHHHRPHLPYQQQQQQQQQQFRPRVPPSSFNIPPSSNASRPPLPKAGFATPIPTHSSQSTTPPPSKVMGEQLKRLVLAATAATVALASCVARDDSLPGLPRLLPPRPEYCLQCGARWALVSMKQRKGSRLRSYRFECNVCQAQHLQSKETGQTRLARPDHLATPNAVRQQNKQLRQAEREKADREKTDRDKQIPRHPHSQVTDLHTA